jgi:hypothetical protein
MRSSTIPRGSGDPDVAFQAIVGSPGFKRPAVKETIFTCNSDTRDLDILNKIDHSTVSLQ